MNARQWRASDRGTISAFVASIMLTLFVLAGLVLDGGLALAAKTRADGQAEAAARAGAQALDLTTYRANGTIRLIPTQAISNARAHLAAQSAIGTVTVFNDTITVTVTTDQPTQLLGLIGISHLSVQGQGSARPRQE